MAENQEKTLHSQLPAQVKKCSPPHRSPYGGLCWGKHGSGGRGGGETPKQTRGAVPPGHEKRSRVHCPGRTRSRTRAPAAQLLCPLPLRFAASVSLGHHPDQPGRGVEAGQRVTVPTLCGDSVGTEGTAVPCGNPISGDPLGQRAP